MQLKELELGGFKSFAQPTTLQFGSGLTAIIGPNGSGKSNLAEAVRWVLGEQSVKQLRGRKSGDVIFVGSPSRQRSRKAYARLTFNNESGRFPHSAAEITIGRQLTQSGESEYTLNGDMIRLIDLQQMLAEAGIGAKSYTVISQGMVDRYLTANPETRRELFDEATGIRSIQIKIARTQRQLVHTQQHANELQTVLQELQPRLQVLKRRARRHEQRGQLEKLHQQKQSLWFQTTWYQQIGDVQKGKTGVEAAAQRTATARAARQSVESELLSALKSVSPPASDQDHQLHQAEQQYQKMQAEYERAKQERAELSESLRQVSKARQQAEEMLHQKKQKSIHFDWLKRTRLILRRCHTVLEKLRGGIRPGQVTVDTLQQEINQMLEYAADELPVNAARSLLSQLEKPLQEVARLKAIEQERKDRLKRLSAISQPSAKQVQALRAAAKQQKPPARDGKNFSTDVEQQLEQVRSEELDAEREGSAARAALEQAQAKLNRLEQEIRRERGTNFLSEIQRQPPSDDAKTPSENELQQLAAKLAALGEADPLALKEYEEVSARYDHLQQQLQDVQKAEQNIKMLTERLQRQMHNHFKTQFQTIQQSFSKYFKKLFGGGQAQLELIEEGVEITVSPPGKKTRHVNMLSGGEKALTSLALLLAILQVQRPPFLVLDEVDAALDEANSQRFVAILKEKSDSTQCVVISHNRETMGQADVLYGVTMDQRGFSKVYSVRLQDMSDERKVKEKMTV